jgi:hypothetical protein
VQGALEQAKGAGRTAFARLKTAPEISDLPDSLGASFLVTSWSPEGAGAVLMELLETDPDPAEAEALSSSV